MTLDEAFATVPRGWGIDVLSYSDGGWVVELWRFDKVPLAESGFTPIRECGRDLAETIFRATLLTRGFGRL